MNDVCRKCILYQLYKMSKKVENIVKKDDKRRYTVGRRVGIIE